MFGVVISIFVVTVYDGGYILVNLNNSSNMLSMTFT